MGDGEQPMPWIHIKDLVGMIEFSIENKHVDGIMNGSGPAVNLKPSSLSAMPMIDRPLRRWDRNSMTMRSPYRATPALCTVSTGYGISLRVRMGLAG